MLQLPNVTLLQVDNVSSGRAQRAFDHCTRDITFGAVTLITEGVSSYEEYNRFCIYELHKHFDTPHVLLIQFDGFIVNPSAWQNEFTDYDYIGAPWGETDRWPNGRVGNGGFSLRSKRFCETSARGPWVEVMPEDQVLCRSGRPWMESQGISFAPVEIAEKFSWEKCSAYPKYANQFGAHSRDSMMQLQRFGIIT